MKPLKIERLVADWVVGHWQKLLVVFLFVCGVVLRFLLLRIESGDYILFLSPWSEEMKASGLKGLANFPGDYNAPYMTILTLLNYLPIRSLYTLKAVSIFFDVVLAFSAALLTYELANNKKKEKAIISFFAIWLSPLVIMNSAAWCQCDSIYGSFCLLSIYFLLKKKDLCSFIFLGLAFAFKLQTIFILPIFFIIWLKKHRFSLLNFVIVPLVDVILCLPALFFGMPLSRIAGVYAGQVGENTVKTTLNYPNIYAILRDGMYNGTIIKFGILFTLVILVVLVCYLLYKNVELNKANIIRIIILTAFTMLMFLPGMHERYGFVAEVIALVYFISIKRSKPLLIYALVFPLLTYSRFLFGTLTTLELESVASVIMYVIVSKKLLAELTESSEKQTIKAKKSA